MAAKSGPIILYIGKDLGYFKTLEGRFQSLLSGDVQFKTYSECLGPEDVSKTFLKTLALKPNVIYIDFSTCLDDHIRLALLLRRDNSSKDIPLVVLVEDSKNLRSCRASGAHFVHIKCGEFHDVVYDPCYLAFPGQVKAPNFAKARANIEVMLIEDFRVGYLTKDYMHIEGNLGLEVGQKITLESNISTDILPSKKFIVRDVTSRNLYYDYRYGSDLNYLYVDPPEVAEDEMSDALGEQDEDKKKKLVEAAKLKHHEAQLEFEDKLKRTIKKFKAWIDDNRDRSVPKDTKILIVDPNLDILKDNKKRLDSYPYTIRLQTFLSEELDEIERTLPDILAFQFVDDDSLKELEGRKTQMDLLEYEKAYEELQSELEDKAIAHLTRVFKAITNLEGYSPIVIIFGCEHYTSKAFQESFKYPLIITHKDDFKLEMVIEMAEVFERKQKDKFERVTNAKILELRKEDPIKNGKLNLSDFIERRYYISKSSDLSFASFSRPVTLETLSESELTLVTEEDLAPGVYRLARPVPLSLTLVVFPDGKLFESSGGKLRRYRAFIHSVGEYEKKELRRFVNEIFGAPKKDKEVKELEAYKALNQKMAFTREESRKENAKEEQKEVDDKLSRNKIN